MARIDAALSLRIAHDGARATDSEIKGVGRFLRLPHPFELEVGRERENQLAGAVEAAEQSPR